MSDPLDGFECIKRFVDIKILPQENLCLLNLYDLAAQQLILHDRYMLALR